MAESPWGQRSSKLTSVRSQPLEIKGLLLAPHPAPEVRPHHMEKLRRRSIVHGHNPELLSLLCVAGPLPHTSNRLHSPQRWSPPPEGHPCNGVPRLPGATGGGGEGRGK